MKDITKDFGMFYRPQSALVFYRPDSNQEGYVEHFDIDHDGSLINAHPLTVEESQQLAKVLKCRKEKRRTALKPESIMDNNILYLDSNRHKVMWFTKKMRRKMLFSEKLGIPNGMANIPPMLWAADRQNLRVFALCANRRPTASTQLYNAPFFNVYADGDVCMGNVDIEINQTAALEEFTKAWENYFFNSYFSHLMTDYNPVDGNCVMLWESLAGTG